MDDEDVLCALALVCVKIKRKKNRKIWVKEWLKKRRNFSHINLLAELKIHPKDWNNYLRMSEETYAVLAKLVFPIIARKNTRMRSCISPHERLTATLRFLATGKNYEDLKFTTVIAPQTLGKIIPDTCQAILTALKEYIKFPKSEEEWKEIGLRFEKRWNFPNCLGAVDGKHIAITPPPGAGSYFYNYKKFHSQVLLGIANSNYELIYFHFGTNGRVSDGGVIRNTDFYKSLMNESLNLPVPTIVKGHELPYVFVGDDAFCLRKDFLKPYSSSHLSKEKKIFNYRLSRARRIIENVFGILANRFQILRTSINLDLENIAVVVNACCAMHNFLRRNSPDTYTPTDCLDIENSETGSLSKGLRSDLVGLQTTRSSSIQCAEDVRNNYADYFNGPGSVPWQDTLV